MLDDHISRLAGGRIRLEIAEQNSQLQTEIVRIRGDMAARGVLNSSTTLLLVAKACADAATERGKLVWQTLNRVLTTAGVRFDEKLADDLKAFANDFLPPTLGDLKGYPKQEAQRLSNQGMAADLEQLVETARVQSLAIIANEIDLFSVPLKSLPSATPTTALDGGPSANNSDIDHLTQLLNRAAFDRELSKLAAQASDDAPASLRMGSGLVISHHLATSRFM